MRKNKPRDLAWWTVGLVVDFHFQHCRDVGILDYGVDGLGMSVITVTSSSKGKSNETHALEPVTRKVRGNSFLKLARKSGHSPSGSVFCACQYQLFCPIAIGCLILGVREGHAAECTL